ncbi:hypothetical protein D3C81_1841560 [compost metagenome]
MQQLITRPLQLHELLPLTAAAREAFEIRRRLVDVPPAYQVKPAGNGFFHIIETATGKVRGFRRKHNDACECARRLEEQGVA